MTENNLTDGDVLRVTTDSGKTLKALQMLVGEQTQANLSLDTENNRVVLKVQDTDINLSQLECNLKKSTIKDLISGLKDFYNLLNEESEV